MKEPVYEKGYPSYGAVNRDMYPDFDIIVTDGIPLHGSPQDRGSADRYYNRSFDPHYWPRGTYKGERVEQDNMTVGEIEAYRYGWDNEEDRKDWG